MTHEPTADELANRRPDPATGAALDPRCTRGRALCIDKTSSTLRWVVDGKVLTTLDVRFGASFSPTREGLFHVFWKDRNHVSTRRRAGPEPPSAGDGGSAPVIRTSRERPHSRS